MRKKYLSITRKSAAAFIAILFVIIFSMGFALPAKAATDTTGRGAGFSAVLYDNTNGLPTSDANAVVQTSEGFIWIGSYSGLIRYDGNEFYRYDSSTGVSSVVSLYEDSEKRLWVGTNDSGVFILENNEFTVYDREQGLRSLSIRSILEDENGNVLIATTTGMAYVDPEGEMHVLDDPLINQEYVCELVEDEDGLIYGVTNSGAFFTIDNLRITDFYDSETLGYGVINTVYPDPDNKGWIYLGTQNSTIVHAEIAKDMKDGNIIEVASQQRISCIRKLDDMLWVCADAGIGYLDDETYYPLKDLPMVNSVEHVMADFENNIWFTSSRQGLMKIVRNRFTDISDLASLEPLVVNSTCYYDDCLYLGADTGLTILNEDYEKIENKLTKLMEGVRIRSIRLDDEGLMWFGTNSDYGLVCYDPEKDDWTLYNTENGLASDRARVSFEMSDGRVAVATNAGVNIIEDGKISATYNADQGISNLEILCLEESPDGSLYAGSDGDGIYVIDDGKVSRLGRDDGLRSEVILRIRKDPYEDDLYWIITSNSLAYMSGNKITTLKNFPYSNNFDMYFDENDRIWVLSSNGIYVVKRDDLMKDENIDYTLYDTESGLPCAATANSYSFLKNDGTLYIAAGTGVSSVNINDSSDGNEEVRLRIPFVMADDTYIPVTDDNIEIPSSCKRLTVYAYAFSYSLNNPHLTYQLSGFDDEMTELTREELRPIAYTNLRGGTYTFEFNLIDTMTGSSEQHLGITIVKEKTIYEHTWFWIVMAIIALLAVAGIITFYFRRKTKALLKKQEENKELIDEMTHVFADCIDMKDPYTNGHSYRVAKYSALLAERLGKSKEEVEDIYRIAMLHDIGKIAIPDSILNKPERLNDEEFVIMKSHSRKGFEILKGISIAPELAIGAGYHHERIDGRGYPNGLKGDEIPEIAQIIAVADTFDAMYSTRPYRKQMDIKDVAAELKKSEGTQLNERNVEAFLELIDEGEIEKISKEVSQTAQNETSQFAESN